MFIDFCILSGGIDTQMQLGILVLFSKKMHLVFLLCCGPMQFGNVLYFPKIQRKKWEQFCWKLHFVFASLDDAKMTHFWSHAIIHFYAQNNKTIHRDFQEEKERKRLMHSVHFLRKNYNAKLWVTEKIKSCILIAGSNPVGGCFIARWAPRYLIAFTARFCMPWNLFYSREREKCFCTAATGWIAYQISKAQDRTDGWQWAPLNLQEMSNTHANA